MTSAETAEALAFAAHHPHVSHWELSLQRLGCRNRLYIAPPKASFADDLPGAGVFPYTPAHILTAPGESRSVWRLPRVFADLGMSFHERQLAEAVHQRRERTVQFRSAPIGQEFVFPARHHATKTPDLRRAPNPIRAAVHSWLEGLFRSV